MRVMFPDAPDEADSEVCEDGTACHWLAAEIWEGTWTNPAHAIAPNGRVITDEMHGAVDMYHSVLTSWQGVDAICEKYVPIPRILEGFGGTPDAWAYNPDTNTLYIADLKFGFRFVEVWENLQLICYACGLIDMLGLNWTTTKIVMTIVQPRSSHRDGPVRTWNTTAAEILPFVMHLRVMASSPSIYMPNPGCGDCPGRHRCMAYQNAALRALEVSYGGGSVHELSPAALGTELRQLKDAAKKLEGRISGLEMEAESLIRKGTPVQGWGLNASYARERIREGCEVELLTLAERYFGGVQISKPVKLITPNQMRKVLPPAIVALYAEKPSTGVRLTKLDPYEARKAFDKLKEQGHE